MTPKRLYRISDDYPITWAEKERTVSLIDGGGSADYYLVEPWPPKLSTLGVPISFWISRDYLRPVA